MKGNIQEVFKEKPRISVDFDGTLRDSIELQEFVKLCIMRGFEVWITTRRSNSKETSREYYETFPPQEVYDTANRLGIKTINFTHGEWKRNFFIGKSNIVHIDDDMTEIMDIITDHMEGKNEVVVYNITALNKFMSYINEFNNEESKSN